jgi:hypothetical protein
MNEPSPAWTTSTRRSADQDAAYRGPCRVLGAHVTRISRGSTPVVICGEYCETGGICLLRLAALDHSLGDRSDGTSQPRADVGCVMLTA